MTGPTAYDDEDVSWIKVIRPAPLQNGQEDWKKSAWTLTFPVNTRPDFDINMQDHLPKCRIHGCTDAILMEHFSSCTLPPEAVVIKFARKSKITIALNMCISAIRRNKVGYRLMELTRCSWVCMCSHAVCNLTFFWNAILLTIFCRQQLQVAVF